MGPQSELELSLSWSPSRSTGLARLEAFVPRAAAYTRERNFDRVGHPDVSRLSPWLRHRLLTEREVASAVLERHSFRAAEKFIQEVVWRTYWKGWLELRPEVWSRYLRDLEGAGQALAMARGAAGLDALAAAEAGQTGIACFDHWARELLETGYLHNHARMWFASIWIFTLRLPWVLGADFFYRHLLDGDPASNTLSWRWVAGLQTRGKHYVARAENIARFSEGRFDPHPGQLAQDPSPLSEPEPLPSPGELRPSGWPSKDAKLGLLLTPEDLSPETSPLADLRFSSVAGGWSSAVARRHEFAAPVVAFKERALADALERTGERARRPVRELAGPWVEAACAWAEEEALEEVVTLEAPVGPWRSELEALERALRGQGRRLVRVRRPWDEALWPRATKGYFAFKRGLEETLRDLLGR